VYWQKRILRGKKEMRGLLNPSSDYVKKATLNDMFSVWMYFLKNPELIPEEFVKRVPEVEEALEELKVLSLNDEFRANYNAHIKAQNDQRSREANAKEEGIAIGKEEGIAIGRKEIVLKLLNKEMALEDIAEINGLLGLTHPTPEYFLCLISYLTNTSNISLFITVHHSFINIALIIAAFT
jgi:hypothetical protein